MKATTIITAVASLAVVLFAGYTATAQEIAVGRVAYGQPYLVQHHASTWTEGYLRGRADLARGAGQYNYLTSIAAINYERARSARMDNHVKGIETYFEGRRVNREARALEAGPKVTQQQLVELARKRAPQRLAENHFEPALGKIFWPAAFDRTDFATERTEIDRLMALRTIGEGGLGSDNYTQVKLVAERLQGKLKANIRDMSGSEYVVAKKFLTSLTYEAQFAPGIEGLAIR